MPKIALSLPLFGQAKSAKPFAQLTVLVSQVPAASEPDPFSAGSQVKLLPVLGVVKVICNKLVMTVAPTFTVTVLVSAFVDLMVKLATPLLLVVPEDTGESVLPVPVELQVTFVPAPRVLLLASLSVMVTVESDELSAAKVAGLATTVEVAALGALGMTVIDELAMLLAKDGVPLVCEAVSVIASALV